MAVAGRGGPCRTRWNPRFSIVADAPTRVVCAGRTDAGVHAWAQVVHFDTEAVRPDTAWVRGVNSHLPESVAVRWAQPVPSDFHARFSALGRRYRYLLLNRGRATGTDGASRRLVSSPARCGASWLQQQACCLGEHDFSAFRSVECQAKSPVKTLRRADVTRHGDLLVFDFEASAFSASHGAQSLSARWCMWARNAHHRSWVVKSWGAATGPRRADLRSLRAVFCRRRL